MSVEASGVVPPQVAVANSQVQNVQAQVVQPKVAEQPKVEQPSPTETVQKLQASVEKLNKLMQSDDRALNFSVDSSTERVVVRVMDTNTKEVIRQIPNEQALKLAEYIDGMVGLIFEDRA